MTPVEGTGVLEPHLGRCFAAFSPLAPRLTTKGFRVAPRD
jgi:hypothetical protein